MSFKPQCRSTLLIPSGDTDHLFVLLTDPVEVRTGKGREVLLVNLSSVKSAKNVDSSCILHPGDHPFITHKSFIRYGRGFPRIEKERNIIQKVQMRVWHPREDFTPEVFSRICSGLESSPKTRPKIRRFYNSAKQS